MSTEETPKVSDEEVSQTPASGETKEEFVARKAYEEVSSDMHKYKAKLKAEAAARSEAEAKLKAIEEAELVKQEEWQQLYEKEREARESAERAAAEKERLVNQAVKKAALRNELGASVKDEYLQFADLDSIELDERGSVSSEAVQAVANKFRQEHPSLIQKSDEAVNITGNAPASNFQPQNKTLNEMSYEEKAAAIRDLKSKRS